MINNTKILRVRHSHLQLINNKLHFKEQLFSGLAYRFSIGGIFIELLMIAGGIEVEKSDDLFPVDEDCLRIDVDFEDEFEEDELSEYEALHTYWQGCKFHGIGFMFNGDGILTDEVTFDSGMELPPRRSWFSNGLLSSLYKKAGERYSWFNNGSLMGHSISAGRNSKYSISINNSKQLEELTLGLEDRLDSALFNEYGIADNFTLMGKGIRNQELFMIIKQIEKGSLQDLSLLGTSITGDFLLSLELDGIEYITISRDELITDDDISTLQKKYPECRVVRNTY